jgi:hypothetical protein
MDKYTATELAFKNGYEKGYEVGKPKWIPVTERLPEEHDSIFKGLYGTKNWLPGMFLKTSGMVLASIEKKDGTRTVKAMYTKDGEWYMDNMPWAKKVTHWMPLPEPPKECE